MWGIYSQNAIDKNGDYLGGGDLTGKKVGEMVLLWYVVVIVVVVGCRCGYDNCGG